MQNTICFFNTTKAWGGGEKWHLDVSKYLTDKGYNIIVVCRKNSELHKRLQKTNINYLALKAQKFSYLNPFKIKTLIKLFRQKKIQTIIINLPSDIKLAAQAAKKAAVARIIYRRGSAIPIKNTIYNRYIFKHWINEILVNSEETKKTINKYNHQLFPEEKIKVIYNGIKLSDFSDCAPRPSTKPKKIILGNIARLEHQKGHKYLLEVAKILKNKNLDFELRIVGEGSLYKAINKQIEEFKLGNYVKLLGFKKDINIFLKSIDIFLLSSLWEGFGYVLTEAMACYKPVVAFNVSSNPEIIENNITGYLVPLYHTEAFAQAVIRLSENEDLRLRLGYNARKRTETLFNLDEKLFEIEKYLTKRP